MDIAVIGLLSLAGYEFSRKKKATAAAEAAAAAPDPEPEPTFIDGNTTHTNMQPYYSGQQPPVAPSHHGKLSIHTGSNLMEHASRDCRPEPENIFAPLKNLVHVNGAPNVDMKERYDPAMKMHNVLPFEQQRVGPGLQTNDPAKGGFHQYFRVKPANVNGYRKNHLQQRLVPGMQAIAMRPNVAEVEAPKIPRHYSMSDRPMEQLKFDVQGPTKRPIVNTRAEHTTVDEIYFGGAHQNAIHSGVTQASRVKDSTQHASVIGNIAPLEFKASNLLSGFIVDGTDRESKGVHLNVVGGGGTYTAPSDVEPTTRSTTQQASHVLNTTGNAYTSYSTGNTTNVGTHRDETATTYEGVAHGVQKASDNRVYQANDTQREFTNSSYGGPSKYCVEEHSRIDARQEQYSMKEDTIQGYMPGPKSTNATVDPRTYNMEFKNDSRMSTHANTPQVGRATTQVSAIGRVEHELKIPVENTRNFFSVANVVLKDNPFAIK